MRPFLAALFVQEMRAALRAGKTIGPEELHDLLHGKGDIGPGLDLVEEMTQSGLVEDLNKADTLYHFRANATPEEDLDVFFAAWLLRFEAGPTFPPMGTARPGPAHSVAEEMQGVTMVSAGILNGDLAPMLVSDDRVPPPMSVARAHAHLTIGAALRLERTEPGGRRWLRPKKETP